MPQVELANLSNLDIPLSALQRTRVYEQTFENGTTDLTANNCTQNVQNTEVYAGQYALEVTVSAGQTGYVETPTRPVSPSQLVTFSFAHKENEYVESIKLAVVWRSASGREISVDEFSLTPSTSWQLDSRTVSAPKHAVSMAIRIIITAKSDGDAVVYLDDITMDLIGFTVRVDGEGNIKINIAVDDVGLAKEETQSSILAKVEALTKALQSINQDKVLTVPSNPPNLDVKLSSRASESTLSGIKTQIDKLKFDENNNLQISINAENVGLAKDSSLQSILAKLDVKLSSRASESTLQTVQEKIDALTKALASIGTDKILTKPDNPANLDVKLSTRASENTLQGIKAKTDKLSFDNNNNLLVGINVDNVGLAKEATLGDVKNKLNALNNALASVGTDKLLTKPDNPPNLDIKLSDVKSTVQSILPRYARLQIYDTSSSTWKDVKDRLPVSIDRDNVGLLKEGGTVNVGNFPSDYPDSGTHSRLDDLKKALQSVGTDKLLTKPDNPPNLDVKLSTRASETTLSAIKSKTDKLTFDANNYLKVNLATDDVGLAKEATLSKLKNALQSVGTDKVLTKPDNPPNLDVKLSDVKSAIQSVLSRYARLQIFNTSSNTWEDVKDQLPINIKSDSVGLAKESTLSKLINALQSVGTDKILVKPDNPPNLDIKLSALDNDIKSELTRKAKLRGYDYVNGVWRDIAVDESGRLLCTLK